MGLLRFCPSLRQNVSDRVGEGLKLIAGRCRRNLDRMIEDQMPFIERIVGSGEPNRSASVLLKKVGAAWWLRRELGFQNCLCGHARVLPK
jgi:hypothetical protein